MYNKRLEFTYCHIGVDNKIPGWDWTFSILDKPIVLVRVLIQTKDLDTPVFTGSCLEDGIAGALDGLGGSVLLLEIDQEVTLYQNLVIESLDVGVGVVVPDQVGYPLYCLGIEAQF